MSFSWFKKGKKNESIENVLDKEVAKVVKKPREGSARNPGSSISDAERRRRTKRRKESKKMRMLNRRNK